MPFFTRPAGPSGPTAGAQFSKGLVPGQVRSWGALKAEPCLRQPLWNFFLVQNPRWPRNHNKRRTKGQENGFISGAKRSVGDSAAACQVISCSGNLCVQGPRKEQSPSSQVSSPFSSQQLQVPAARCTHLLGTDVWVGWESVGTPAPWDLLTWVSGSPVSILCWVCHSVCSQDRGTAMPLVPSSPHPSEPPRSSV